MKINIFKITAMMLVLAGSFPSCKENPKEISLAEYSLCEDVDSGCLWTDIEDGKAAKAIIINSKEELENYITPPKYSDITRCSELSIIDFSEHTLLLTQGWTLGGAIYCFPEVSPRPPLPELQQLTPNKYLLNLEMRLSNNKINRQWNRAFIVNKLSDKSIVELNVNILLENERPFFNHDETASIIGKWKLIEKRLPQFRCPPALIIDYSPYNTVYEFESNGVLTITGDPKYYIWPGIGEHSYSFIDEDSGSGSPGLPYGLQIGDFSKFWYRISSEQLVIDQRPVDGDAYYFIKIN